MRSLSILLLVTLLSACTHDPQAGVPQEREAVVLSVSAVSVGEDAEVIASGHFLSSCEAINPRRSTVRLEDKTFIIRLWTRRLAQVCNPVIVPFRFVLPLELTDVPVGTYTVTVNRVSTTLTLTSRP